MTTKDDLRELLKECLQEISPPAPEKEQKYLTRHEAAEKLGITLPTLHHYTKRGLITAHRVGTRILYKDVDLENALREVIPTKPRR